MRALLLHLFVAFVLITSTASSPAPAPVAASPCPEPSVVYVPAPAVEAAPSAPAARSLAESHTLPSSRFGYVNRARITVRERPSDASKVAARLDRSTLGEYPSVSILMTSGDYFYVTIESAGDTPTKTFEGWVKFGEVVPAAAAMLVDAESGAMRAVLPLSEDTVDVRFSSDGTRAILLGHGMGCGDNLGGSVVVEVDTRDLSIVRTVHAPSTEQPPEFVAAYYDPQNGALRVMLVEWTDFRLSAGLVDETGAVVALDEICTGVDRVVVAHDSRSAVAMVRNSEPADQSKSYHVIDLRALSIARTVTVDTAGGAVVEYDVMLTSDGSEILSTVDDTLVSINTATGKLAWTKTVAKSDGHYLWLRRDSASGSMHIAAMGDDSGSYGVRRSYSVANRAVSPVDRRLAFMSTAGDARFGADLAGKRVFRFDENGRVASTVAVARPDLTGTLTVDEKPSLYGFTVTPDARHLVLLVGVPSGC